MAERLYTYGIFRSKTTLERALGHRFEGTYQAATLRGYRAIDGFGPRYAVPDDEGQISDGFLIDGLTLDELEGPLDRIEGTASGHYVRIQVEAPDGGPCWLYVAGKQARRAISKAVADRLDKADKERRRQYRAAADTPAQEAKLTRNKRTAGQSRWAAIKEVLPSDGTARRLVQDDRRTLVPAFPLTRQPEPPRDWRHGWFGSNGSTNTTALTTEGKGEDGLPKVESPPKGYSRKTPIPLFAYGNLCFRQTLEDRIGHEWASEYYAGYINGFRITRTWPRYAVPAKGEKAHGFLLPGLTDEDLAIIDRYEGVHSGVYRRVLVKVNGRLAWMYAIGPRGRERVNAKLREEATRAKANQVSR